MSTFKETQGIISDPSEVLEFDIESDGLLDTITKIHCIVLSFGDSDKLFDFHGKSLEDGIRIIQDHLGYLVGHNIVKYDLMAIKKLYPWFTYKGKPLDTQLWGQLVFPDISELDFSGTLWQTPGDKKLLGRYSLKAWGVRLGTHKSSLKTSATNDEDNEDVWSCFTDDMLEYCKQDVRVLRPLWKILNKQWVSKDALELEHQVAHIIGRQEQYGINFNMVKAYKLWGILERAKEDVVRRIRDVIPPRKNLVKVFVPKRDNRTLGYTAGVPFHKYEISEFNPGSRKQVIEFMKDKHDWVPDEFTEAGNPKVDDEILSGLEYPEAKLFCEYYLITKRISQLQKGDQAWMTKAKSLGTGEFRVYGSVSSCGAVTRRMRHFGPNLAQVPKIKKGIPYGRECRDLFEARPGQTGRQARVFVGCDADALELRCQAHYLYPWDRGEFAEAAIRGDKEKGTDVHTRNMRSLRISDRDTAKTWYYAWLYGAGDTKLGKTLSGVSGQKNTDRNRRTGKRSRAAFEENQPHLAALLREIKSKVKARKYLVGLDGQRLRIRSEHSALNTLLQSAGAIIMKRALVILDSVLQSKLSLVPGVDYEFVLNIHDEFQIETTPELAHVIGEAAAESIAMAGEYYGFMCPVSGTYKVGNTWAETH